MQLALCTLAARLSTFALEFIDRSFDYRPIGEERVKKLPNLIREMNEGLPKAAKLTLICFRLYAHYYIDIQNSWAKVKKK
jgi:hypothetical protein